MEDASKIKGADVYGADNKKIGTVSTVLMKPDGKTVDRQVVVSGSVLGIGGHHVAVPLDQFSWDGSEPAAGRLPGVIYISAIEYISVIEQFYDVALISGAGFPLVS
jgi:hypothetical protein